MCTGKYLTQTLEGNRSLLTFRGAKAVHHLLSPDPYQIIG